MSAICFNLDQAKVLSSGNGLMYGNDCKITTFYCTVGSSFSC